LLQTKLGLLFGNLFRQVAIELDYRIGSAATRLRNFIREAASKAESLLPLSRGGIWAGLTLGFARALGDFGVTLMVAGNIPGLTQTGALAIYDAVQANREAEAAGLVAAMTAFAVVALYAGTQLARRRPHAW
jgi:ABC-type molybdate transport system permease subunit